MNQQQQQKSILVLTPQIIPEISLFLNISEYSKLRQTCRTLYYGLSPIPILSLVGARNSREILKRNDKNVTRLELHSSVGLKDSVTFFIEIGYITDAISAFEKRIKLPQIFNEQEKWAVKYLIQHINPSYESNRAVVLASKFGHSEIIKIFLSDPRVDPSDQKNKSLFQAAVNGNVEIVRILLNDPRITVHGTYKASLAAAADRGNVEIVELLLNHRSVDPNDYFMRPALQAEEKGHSDVVQKILEMQQITKENKDLFLKEVGKLQIQMAAFTSSNPHLQFRSIHRKDSNFGTTLELLMKRNENNDGIPRIVKNLVSFIETTGLSEPGIYRVSANAANVSKLKLLLDEDPNYDLVDNAIKPHEAASVLKSFFRELSNAMITNDQYNQLIESSLNPDINMRLENIRKIMSTGSKATFTLWKFLIIHLAKVASYSTINKMSSSNLAIVWSPNLFDSGDASKIEHFKLQGSLLEFIISRFDRVFDIKWKVFGRNINELSICETLKVPKIVKNCILFVEKCGIVRERIYSVSGSISEISKLRFLLDEDPEYNLMQLMPSVHSVTGVLKLFFRSLPQPLIPKEIHPSLVDASRKSKRIDMVRKLVNTIPKLNFFTLKFLVEHLSLVSAFESTNKMTIYNLAISWNISLLGVDSIDLNPSNLIEKSSLIEFFIMENQTIFLSD